MLPTLRDYQQDSIQGLRIGVSEGHLRKVLVAPTGAGKLVIAHAIDSGLRERCSVAGWQASV
jgi:superfamily II DNA or RNA helicase